MTPWHTPAALAWMQSLLRERWGMDLILRTGSEGGLVLSLPDSAGEIAIESQGATFTRADSALPCGHWEFTKEGWSGVTGGPERLPTPGLNSPASPLIETTDKGWRVRYDVLGFAYWMLTRREEVGRSDLDGHERFPATASHAHRHGYLERPVVDEWLHVLGQVVQRQWPGVVLRRPPFSVRVSHDVDAPVRYGFCSAGALARACGSDLLRSGRRGSALLAPWIRLRTSRSIHPADPYNCFDWIMDTSERHGLRSAFYFLCGHTDPHDADYDPGHPAIRHLMRRIHQRGHELGLHPSYGTFRRPDLIAAEAARLKSIASEEGIVQPEWGGRMHYLRWEQPTTLRAWDEAGMSYDSTLGYADRPGFRCGTCFEYPAFDPVADEALSLRIRPLIAMECSVTAPRYMGLGSGAEALGAFTSLKDACSAVGGCFTLLWHNSELVTRDHRELYEAVLAHKPPVPKAALDPAPVSRNKRPVPN